MLDLASPEYAAAHNLWSKGKGHLFGVLALEEASRTYASDHDIEDAEKFIFSGHYSASLHLLLGFAAELLTKAAYIFHGGAPEFIRRQGIRHDLIRLLDEAEERGFEAPDLRTREIFEYLQEPHLIHQFRYGEEDEIAMPSLVHTVPALQAMSDQLQNLLEAAG